MTKSVSTSKKPRKQHSPEFRSEALKFAERELEMSTGIARLKRQLAERDEELAILQKAATYFAKRLK